MHRSARGRNGPEASRRASPASRGRTPRGARETGRRPRTRASRVARAQSGSRQRRARTGRPPRARSEERRVGKSVDLGGRRIIKKKKEKGERKVDGIKHRVRVQSPNWRPYSTRQMI